MAGYRANFTYTFFVLCDVTPCGLVDSCGHLVGVKTGLIPGLNGGLFNDAVCNPICRWFFVWE
jgi:hypothetical protein